MPMATLPEFYAQLDRRRDALFTKASISAQIAGQHASLWLAASLPAAGVAPGAAAIASDATTGAMLLPLRSGSEERLAGFVNVITTNAGAGLVLEDRLGHMSGLNGTLTTAQTVNLDMSVATSNLVARIGKADYSEITWWMEWYVATGATTTTPTINVTFHDNTAGTAQFVALPASIGASRRYPIVPVNGKFIKSVQSIQLSASTGTAGNFGVTAVRQHAVSTTDVASKLSIGDWPTIGVRPIADNACLTLSTLCNTTTTGTITGSVGFAVN